MDGLRLKRGLTPTMSKVVSEATTEKLLEIGHRNLNTIPSYYGRGIGDANSVMKLPDGFIGVSDPRNAGGAKGVGAR